MRKHFKRLLVIVTVLAIMLGVAYVWLRYHDNLIHRHELRASKNFLKAIITQDTPSQEWMSQCNYHNPSLVFFTFKVWFTEKEVTPGMIDWSYIDFPVSQLNNANFLELKYGRNLPIIECRVTEANGRYLIRPNFPLNNCLFNPDYNNDGVVNMADVILAKKMRQANR